LGFGDWAQSPIPNPQSPIPNPQSPIYQITKIIIEKILKYYIIQIFITLNSKNIKKMPIK